MLVDGRNPGNLRAVHHLAVRLVRNQKDRLLARAVSLGQHHGERLQVLTGVDGAGGVVGRVDNDRRGIGGNRVAHGRYVDLEGLLIRQDLAADGAGVFNPHAVLGKERGDHNDLLARIHQSVKRAGNRRRSTHGHKDVLSRIRGAKTAVERCRDGRARGGQAGGRRVAVKLLAGKLSQRVLNGIAHGGGRRHRRVAQAKVKYVLGTNLLFALASIGKDLADHRAFGAALVHGLVDHDSPFRIREKSYLFAVARFANPRNETRC